MLIQNKNPVNDLTLLVILRDKKNMLLTKVPNRYVRFVLAKIYYYLISRTFPCIYLTLYLYFCKECLYTPYYIYRFKVLQDLESGTQSVHSWVSLL